MSQLEPNAQVLKPSRAPPVATLLLVACLVILAGTALPPAVTARLRSAASGGGGRPIHVGARDAGAAATASELDASGATQPPPPPAAAAAGAAAAGAAATASELDASGATQPPDAAARHCPAIAATPAAFPVAHWFVKVPKVGGTTIAGVLRTVAAHHGGHALEVSHVNKGNKTLASFNSTLRAAWAVLGGRQVALGITGHLPFDDAKAALLQQSSAAGLLLFTAVRHPVAHFHSHFFHNRCYLAATSLGIRRERGYACDNDARVLAAALAGDTTDARWKYARQPAAVNAQYDYMRGNASSVAEAAAKYHFIFVTERMNEALVTFMLRHGLRFEDIAHLSSKNRTGKYDGPERMPAELNAFVAQRSDLDLQLWELANARLDAQRRELTRQCDGHDVVGATLAQFERLLQRVRQECADAQAWHAAHGLSGHPLAYRGDTGLGFRCVRHVARRFQEEEWRGGGGGGGTWAVAWAQRDGHLSARLGAAAAAAEATLPPCSTQHTHHHSAKNHVV